MTHFYLILLLGFFYFNIETSASTDASSPLTGLTYMSSAQKNVKWAQLPIKLCVSATIPKNIQEQISAAANVWNKTFATTIFDTSCSTKSQVYKEEDSSVHGIYWLTNGFEQFTDKTSLARTIVQYDDDGVVTDADILLNGQFYDWSKLPIDSQTVVIHELGHVLGLKHYFLSLNSAMNYYPYVSGYRHRSIGEYEAIVFNALYKKETKTKVPHYLKLYFLNKYKEAATEIEKIKTKTADDHYALGIIYKMLKKVDLSKINLAKVVKEKPKLTFVRQQYAEVLWSSGDVENAEKEFSRVLQDEPGNYEALANMGSMHLQKKDLQKAKEYFQKSLAAHPAHWVACQLLFNQTKEQRYRECVLKYGPVQSD